MPSINVSTKTQRSTTLIAFGKYRVLYVSNFKYNARVLGGNRSALHANDSLNPRSQGVSYSCPPRARKEKGERGGREDDKPWEWGYLHSPYTPKKWHHKNEPVQFSNKPQLAGERFHCKLFFFTIYASPSKLFSLRVIQLRKDRSSIWLKKPVHLDISCIPLVKKHIFRTELVWPSNVLTHVKSDKAHILIVESAEEVATHWSTGENLTHQIPFLWPRKVPNGEPSDIFQIYKETSISESSLMLWDTIKATFCCYLTMKTRAHSNHLAPVQKMGNAIHLTNHSSVI